MSELDAPGGDSTTSADPLQQGVLVPLARLAGFHPGWFGAVMGTAIVGVASYLNPGNVTGATGHLQWLGEVMVIVAAVLAVVLGVPYVARWFRHPGAALADLRDPVTGALYGTFPGGLLVLGAAAAAVGPSVVGARGARTLDEVLAWVGVPLAFVISVTFALHLFARAELDHQSINGAWFIPPVVNIVVPMVLVPLVPGADPATARLLLLASYGFWGMGFMLFLLVFTTLHHRLIAHPLPPAGLAPSLWIGLGPVGVGAITLVKMGSASRVVFGAGHAGVESLSLVAASALWGFGLWWLVAAALLLARYLRQGPLPYGLGWWAFTFPLGAFTVATLTVARSWRVAPVEWLGLGLFVLLMAFWLVVAVRTAWAVGASEVSRGAAPRS
jgi:C4-dicarboxylate transporter/malic acid transport protein